MHRTFVLMYGIKVIFTYIQKPFTWLESSFRMNENLKFKWDQTEPKPWSFEHSLAPSLPLLYLEAIYKDFATGFDFFLFYLCICIFVFEWIYFNLHLQKTSLPFILRVCLLLLCIVCKQFHSTYEISLQHRLTWICAYQFELEDQFLVGTIHPSCHFE